MAATPSKVITDVLKYLIGQGFTFSCENILEMRWEEKELPFITVRFNTQVYSCARLDYEMRKQEIQYIDNKINDMKYKQEKLLEEIRKEHQVEYYEDNYFKGE